MLARRFIIWAIAGSSFFAVFSARAQSDSALLDLLVKKHIITDKEAQAVRADLKKEAATTSAGKVKLSTPITELEIYGDARVRYEVRNGESGPPSTIVSPNDTYQRNRSRYRLRLGLRGLLADDWFFGVRLETSSNPRSTNVTFGDDSGPFGKSSDGAFVGQAYFGYTGFKNIKLTAGRMPNPFVTTSMVWDPDLNPEGLAEQYKHTFTINLGGGSPGVESMSKDGKTMLTSGEPPRTMTIDFFANFGQFVYDDENPENPIGTQPPGVPNTDAFMLGWQVGARVNFSKTVYLQVAPTIYNYTGNGDSFYQFFSGDPTFVNAAGATVTPNQTGINSLLVFDMPAEFDWTWGELPMRIFGDFAVNLDADDRAAAAGHPDKGDDRYAYQIGLSIGKLKAKHDWQIAIFYQHTDQYSLDPNLVDSDIFDSRVNMQGVAIQAGYALSDAIFANLTYAYGEQSDSDLGTGGVGDIPLNPLRKYQVFQADLNVKF